jgi:hypothetical protein
MFPLHYGGSQTRLVEKECFEYLLWFTVSLYVYSDSPKVLMYHLRLFETFYISYTFLPYLLWLLLFGPIFYGGLKHVFTI